MSQEFRCPPRIITGDGSAASVGAEAAALGATRAVVVTDRTLHEKTDFISDAVASLKTAGLAVEVFDDVEPDPMVSTARRGAEFARAFGPDLVVGLGGGSALDIAKATAAILANERPLDAIAMAMGGRFGVPHGVANALILPYVMEFNESTVEAEYARIAGAMGEGIEGLPPEKAAHLASVAVHRLVVDVGLPHTLSDVKIPREGIPGLAEESFGNQRLLRNNPRAASVQDITGILEAASGARR